MSENILSYSEKSDNRQSDIRQILNEIAESVFYDLDNLDVESSWEEHEEILQETREEHIERLRNSPLHLCRLRYFDKDKWGFAYFNYSNEKYEMATYPDGEFFGKPEDAFLASAVFFNG